MKKISNISFIIALIICILMLFAYCSKINATDVSIITGDIYNGDLTPDNPDYIPPQAPSNINTNVYYPFNFGDNIATNPVENTNIFSSYMNYDSFNNNINSNSMYYTKDILSNKQYNYYSVYSFLYQYNLSIPAYIDVDVVLSSIDYSVTTTGYVYFDTQFADSNIENNFFYNAKTYRCDSVQPTADYFEYSYCFLVVDMPVYNTFNELSNNLYYPGFYIDEIIFRGTEFDLVGRTEIFATHLFDVCYPVDTYLTPSKNTTFLSVINNIGSYADIYNLNDMNYMLFSQIDISGEKLQVYSGNENYSFDSITGKFLYTSFENSSKNFTIDFLAFVNYNYFLDYMYYAADNLTYFYDLLNSLKYNFNSLSGMPYINYSANSVYNFFNVGYTVNGVSRSTGILPFYSSFNFFTLMPDGDDVGFGSLSYNDLNAKDYYIEPQSKTDYGAYVNNIIVWICFEMPLLKNLTKPCYLFLNGFLNIWTNIALPLATACGLVGGGLIFYIIYIFISKVAFNKEPD